MHPWTLANLMEATLTGADLTGAKLFNADLRDTNLQGANLTDVQGWFSVAWRGAGLLTGESGYRGTARSRCGTLGNALPT